MPAQGLSKVTVLVPEDSAERIQQLVGPEHSALCRPRHQDARCGPIFWTVAVLGQLNPVAEGRAKDRAEARWQAESAAAACFADRAKTSDGGSARDD